MAAQQLDGKSYAAEITAQVVAQVAAFKADHGRVRLAAILVGSDDAGRLYARSQSRRCEQVGIEYELVELPERVTQEQLLAQIERLNDDDTITGIMLHLPLPQHLDEGMAQFHIDPYKDVEGVTPSNIGLLFYNEPIIAPCTALAVLEVIQRSGKPVHGADAVVVGQSRIVGRPITMFLNTRMATVTGCHIATRDLPGHTRRGDILVVAVGKPGIIGAEHVKPGAVVVDVGINSVTTTGPDGEQVHKTVGDVDYDAVVDLAGAITPVPGGVGPLTVAMLLRNTVEAARKQLTRRR